MSGNLDVKNMAIIMHVYEIEKGPVKHTECHGKNTYLSKVA